MKLDYKKTFLIGLVFFSITMISSLHDSLTPKILYSFGVGETAIGTIMAVDNILAIIMMPLFGWFSDKTNTKYGKRTPYFFWGTIFSALFLVLLPIADSMRSLPMFIAVLCVFLLSLATYRSPGVSLMSDVTPKPLRSKANGVINLMGALAGIIAILLMNFMYKERIMQWEYNALGDKLPILGSDGMPILNPDVNNIPLYACVAVIAIAALILYLCFIKENELVSRREAVEKEYDIYDEIETHGEKIKAALSKEEKKSLILILCAIFLWFFGYNAVFTFFSNYAAIVLNIEGGGFAKYVLLSAAAGVLTFLPAGFISAKIGRRKTILAGIIILAAAFSLGVFIREVNLLIYIMFIFAGSGWALINVNSLPMIVEFAKAGNIGQFTGYYYFASMCAQTLTPIICGALIEYLILGYRILFAYGAAFIMLAAIPMLFTKHGDGKPIKTKGILESFDVD